MAESKKTVYIVGHNMAGYMPETVSFEDCCAVPSFRRVWRRRCEARTDSEWERWNGALIALIRLAVVRKAIVYHVVYHLEAV